MNKELIKTYDEPIEIRLNSGEMGRIWEIRTGRFGWAHPNGSQGDAKSFRAAEDELNDVDAATTANPPLEFVHAAALANGEKAEIRNGELFVFAHSGPTKAWQSFTDCPQTALGMLAERAGMTPAEYLADGIVQSLVPFSTDAVHPDDEPLDEYAERASRAGDISED